MKLSLIFLILISIKLWQVAAFMTKEFNNSINESKNYSGIEYVPNFINENTYKRSFETDKSFKELSGKKYTFLEIFNK